MFCEIFTIVGTAGLESYKLARKNIDDIYNSYSLHRGLKLKDIMKGYFYFFAIVVCCFRLQHGVGYFVYFKFTSLFF